MAWCHPKIEFTKSIYFPGEEVTGRVWVTTEKDMTARKVEISFIGRAITAWHEDEKGRRKTQTLGSYQKSEEKFIEMKHEVWTPETEENNFPAGEYEWNFSFELPKDCPMSFEGIYGFIRYSVTIEIDVPKWLDTIVEKAVNVSSPIDLNSIPGAKDAVEIQRESELQACGCLPCFSFGPFRRGNIIFTLSTSSLGYVPGQKFTFNGRVDNQSTRPIETISLEFFRREFYKKDSSKSLIKFNNKNQDLDDYMNGKKLDLRLRGTSETAFVVPVGGSKKFTIDIEIPSTVATIRSCRYLSVEYLVKATVHFNSFVCASSSGEMNIIIGNVPFLESGNNSLPPHTFEPGYTAEVWTSRFKEEFRPQYPFYGMTKSVEPE